MNRSQLVSRSAAAIGIAVSLAVAPGFARASSLNFSPTIFSTSPARHTSQRPTR